MIHGLHGILEEAYGTILGMTHSGYTLIAHIQAIILIHHIVHIHIDHTLITQTIHLIILLTTLVLTIIMTLVTIMVLQMLTAETMTVEEIQEAMLHVHHLTIEILTETLHVLLIPKEIQIVM